ncbi:MAG TPA: heavy metal-binding domain-containing protein, partial [Chthoniobacterales bacterium]
MKVSRAEPRGGAYEYDGTTYYFCNPKCRERFAADPKKYLKPEVTASPPPVATAPVYVCPMDPEVRASKPGPCPQCGMALEPERALPSTKTEWVCPMHPEIVRDAPGACPICGMALEPRTATIEADNPELRDMTRRFRVAVALSAPLLALVMGEMLLGHRVSAVFPPHMRGWVELVLATPVCLWSGLPFLERAVQSVKNRSLNMFTLIGLGVSVAYVFSVIGVVAPGVFPASFRTEHGEVGLYF